MVKAVLFDLDGTLLPMDQNVFLNEYFGLMAKKMYSHGYDDSKKLIDTIWKSTYRMIKNDGNVNNCDAFWNAFAAVYGEQSRNDIPLFDDYYRNEFENVKKKCGFSPLASQAVRAAKDRGAKVALATNPLFPAVGTHARARWAGLDVNDFELITTYENIGYCKPNPAYYTEIATRLNVSADECLMVGNDTSEDILPASGLNMKVFLLTDCLINTQGIDIDAYPHGGFPELIDYITKM